MSAYYYTGYPGYWTMKWHDKEDDMRRWFKNYAPSRFASYPEAYEWLTIEEETRTVRGRRVVTYVGTVGADHHDKKRIIRFEPGAPPPPTFMQPVRRKWEPPVEPTGYERRIRERSDALDALMYMAAARTFTPQQRFIANVLPPVEIKPTFRRN